MNHQHYLPWGSVIIIRNHAFPWLYQYLQTVKLFMKSMIFDIARNIICVHIDMVYVFERYFKWKPATCDSRYPGQSILVVDCSWIHMEVGYACLTVEILYQSEMSLLSYYATICTQLWLHDGCDSLWHTSWKRWMKWQAKTQNKKLYLMCKLLSTAFAFVLVGHCATLTWPIWRVWHLARIYSYSLWPGLNAFMFVPWCMVHRAYSIAIKWITTARLSYAKLPSNQAVNGA